MSREEAVDYIADHTAIPRSQIEKEVDRYITWPGQACAYKMGELEILRLRRKAEQQLGMYYYNENSPSSNAMQKHDECHKKTDLGSHRFGGC